MNSVSSFLDFLESKGFTDLPSSVPLNTYVRFANGGNPKNPRGWLILFQGKEDGTLMGVAGDWKSDGTGKHPDAVWCSKFDDGRILSESEKQERTKLVSETINRHLEALKKEQMKVALQCRTKWNTFAQATPNHPYLLRKKVLPYGIRQTVKDGQKCLVIPFGDDEGIQTLEYIGERNFSGTDRNKSLEKGGRAMGCWFKIGEGEPAFICEGYATACSVYAATGKSVVSCYSAGNILNVAKRFPKAIIVADNDSSKTGELKAQQASQAYGNRVVLIPDEGMDANDYAVAYGMEMLKKILTPKPMFQRGGSLLKQASPQGWLIRDWIPQGESLIQLYATAGTGKSFLCLDWLLSIACGMPEWFGHKVREGRVCYIFGEGERGLSKRIAYWIQEHGGADQLESKLDRNFLYNIARMPKIDDFSQLTQLMEQLEVEEFNPDLIVLDTLNRAMSGDENSTKDGTDFITACDKLKEKYNCGILLIHHKGWNKEHSRGTTTIPASVDMDFELESKGDGVLELSQTKNKDFEIQLPEYMKLVGGEIDGWFDEDHEPVKSAVLVKIDKPESEKSDRQIHDEQLCLNAFYEHGLIDSEDQIRISRDNLLKFLQGKLLDKNGAPLSKERLQTEVNPNQSTKFIGRLVNRYCYLETIQSAGKTPIGWILRNEEACQSFRRYTSQQEILFS